MLASVRSAARGPLLQVGKTSVAAVASWLLAALLLGQPAPIFAAIAALLVVQPSVNQSVAKGIERSIGVVLGVILAYAAGVLFGDATWVVLTVIVASLLLAWVLKLTPGSSNQIPISAMLVLVIGSQSAGYAIDRVLETVIGALVGLAVNAAIVPPVLVAPARLAVGRLATAIAGVLEDIAGTLTRRTAPAELEAMMLAARKLRPLQLIAAEELDDAEDSLSFNPRAPRYRTAIEQDRELLGRLSILVTRSIGMARAVRDNYDPALVNDPVADAIAGQLRRAAHDTTLLSRRLAAMGSSSRRSPIGIPPLDDAPVLTAPLVVTTPNPQNWVLIGALLEDLRRIREEITGEDA